MSQSIQEPATVGVVTNTTNALSTIHTTSGHRNNSSSIPKRELYIYELPYTCRQQLCEHLDQLDVWQQLAALMKLHTIELQQISREQKAGKSAIDELLHIWGGQYNHTVNELFSVFYKQKLYPAMRIIKAHVDRKYHRFIIDSSPDLPALLLPPTEKLLNGSAQNIDTSDNNNSTSYNSSSCTNSKNNEDEQNQEKPLSNYLSASHIEEYACSLLEIDYAELTTATSNWNEQNILGKGGFGTVYRGNWKYTSVAIKQIHYRGKSDYESVKVQIQQSLNELKYLNSCRHDNVLPLYGYSIKGDKPCLVYQLMKGGSLDERLYQKDIPPLTWQQRMNICFYTARGINFLHTFRSKPLIHGDIKPANVLLDDCMRPKIGDFGLAREGPNAINISVQVTQPVGTRYYLPPEYIKLKKLSTKVDIYSFGLVVLETFTGLRIFERTRKHALLATYVRELSKEESISKLIDTNIPMTTSKEQEMCISSMQVALNCIAFMADDRPEMEQVLHQLNCFVEI